MGIFVFKRWPALGLVGISCLIQPAGASTVTAQASAEVISPADVSAQAATQLLFSSTPGVLILTIPGSAGLAASSIELTATGAEGSGPFVFTAYNRNAPTMAQLVTVVTQASAFLTFGGSLSTDLATRGVLNGQGIQIVVLMAAQSADGSGTLAAIITYD